MNRRQFIQSLVAVFSLPAGQSLSFSPATAALPTAAAVPARARSWAVYMSTLHGECSPQALQSMLNIPATEAKKYVTQLVAEGVIKPNPLMRNSLSKLVKTEDESLLDKAKKRLEMKAQSKAEEKDVGLVEPLDAIDGLEDEGEAPEETPDGDLDAVVDDEYADVETQTLEETELRS